MCRSTLSSMLVSQIPRRLPCLWQVGKGETMNERTIPRSRYDGVELWLGSAKTELDESLTAAVDRVLETATAQQTCMDVHCEWCTDEVHEERIHVGVRSWGPSLVSTDEETGDVMTTYNWDLAADAMADEYMDDALRDDHAYNQLTRKITNQRIGHLANYQAKLLNEGNTDDS